MSKYFLLIGLLSWAGLHPAQALAMRRGVYLGAGWLSESMNKYTSDPTSGSVSLLGRGYLNLVLRGSWPISSSGDLTFSPALSFTPLGGKSPEGGETTRLLSLCPRLTLDL